MDLWQEERELRQRGFINVVGVDEAGRGPLAGPVVAAAVILPDNGSITGINDSKKLTEKQREKLFGSIFDEAIAVGVGLSSPLEIDELNILQASFLAMRRALLQMALDYDVVLIDGNQRIPTITKPQKTVIGGDGQCACIAAASVIAKVTRDRMMLELHNHYPMYAFDQHKGYGTELHLNRLQEHGISPVHRKSFAPVAKLLGERSEPQCLLPL
ncbi:MAG: ribonuclease HII [bacterium]